MPDVVDFYQYKYSRSNYYINLVFEKEKIKNIKKEGFKVAVLSKDGFRQTVVIMFSFSFPFQICPSDYEQERAA